MGIELGQREMEAVMGGQASGITRWFDGTCPYKPGDKLVLEYRPDPKNPMVAPVAKVEVRAVRPWSVNERRANARDLAAEGWRTFEDWLEHFQRMYTCPWEGSEVLHTVYVVIQDRAPFGHK